MLGLRVDFIVLIDTGDLNISLLDILKNQWLEILLRHLFNSLFELCLTWINLVSAGKPLGKGTFGQVKQGTHILTGEKVSNFAHCCAKRSSMSSILKLSLP